MTETRVDEALALELRQHRAIVDGAPANIYVKDLDGRYLFVNQPLVAQTGIPAERYLGHTDEEVFHGRFTEDWRSNDQRALEGRLETIEVIGDPIRYVYRSLKFPLRDADGRPYALCGISIDITEEHRADRARRVAERRVTQLEAIDSLGRFATGMAHDLKNTLGAVRALVELAIEDVERLPESKTVTLGEVLGEARDAVVRATDQIARMMAASQPQQQDAEPCAVGTLLDRLRPLLQQIVPADRLVVQVPDGLSPVLADPGDLERILVNLVTNAAEATETTEEPAQPVLLSATQVVLEERIDTDTPPYGLDLDAGTYLRIDVTDHGVGMPPDVLVHAVQPLFTTKPEGTGVGLWSAHALALRNAGALTLRSAPGAGTTASVWIPASFARR